jgi:hypothetical protein
LIVFSSGSKGWNIGKKFLAIFVGRYGSTGIWLFFRTIHLLWSGFATKLYRTWDKSNIYKLYNMSRSLDLPCWIGIWQLFFFYGASQCKGQKCGVGAILKFPYLGTFSIKMNCGMETNTKGEHLALWCILYLFFFKKVKILQLISDLKIIID